MIRKIIHIDEDKCTGCGLCARACHEGAIDIVDGKARLVREHFCDGFGDCLPNCPAGAITFEEREAPAYDEEAVLADKKQKAALQTGEGGEQSREEVRHTDQSASARPGGPGSRLQQFKRSFQQNRGPSPVDRQKDPVAPVTMRPAPGMVPPAPVFMPDSLHPASQLNQWPCQIKLLPTKAPFFEGAKLLIAADCTAYAYAAMHEDFMKGRITVIGCPKLDNIDYTDKLTAILRDNEIRSVTLVRMEVPCCGGLQRAAQNALKNSGKSLPWQVFIISCDGRILE